MKPNKDGYVLYIVRCADTSLYCGITNNLKKRITDHNERKAGAKYTRAKRPVTLVYTENHPNRSEALKREYEIKKLPKQEKEALIQK